MGRTLVTGGTGFIGSHLVQLLARRGESVRVLTRKGRPPANRPELETLDTVEWVAGDLLEANSIDPLLRGIDKVYHLAGWISTRSADAERVRLLNHTVSTNLLAALARHRQTQSALRTVYLASIFALGGGTDSRAGRKETDPYNLERSPVPYFHAKRAAELEFRKAAEAGEEVVFVYPCYCLGPGDVELSSSRLLWMLLRGLSPLVPAGGWNVMDVRDAAAGLLLGMERGQAGRQYIIGGENQSFREFARQVRRVCTSPRVWGTLPGPVGGAIGALLEQLVAEPPLDRQSAWIADRCWYYDDSRARAELGYSSRDLKETLRDAAHWFRTAPQAPQPAPR